MSPSLEHPLLGAPLPSIARVTLDGGKLEPDSLRGRVVVVKFFAEYCKPCVRTLPEAERLHGAHPSVAFVGVDEDDSIETAARLAARYRLTFPIVHDRDNVLSGRFRVTELPVIFVADTKGTIRWVGNGAASELDVGSAIEELSR